MTNLEINQSQSYFHLPSMIAKLDSNGSPLYSSCKQSPKENKSFKLYPSEIQELGRSISLND